MKLPRAPWWIYLLAASYLFTFAHFSYLFLFGPEPVGMRANFDGRALVVQAVVPGLPGDRAGLKPGDRILALDDLPVRTSFDWDTAGGQFEAGRVHRLEVQRGSARLELPLKLARSSPTGMRYGASGAQAAWGGDLLVWPLEPFLALGAKSVTLALALMIAFLRPNQLTARLGALFLGSMAIAYIPAPYGSMAAWRNLPGPLGALLWIPVGAMQSVPALAFAFFATFPRTLFRARWAWVLALAPAPLAVSILVWYLYRAVYYPARAMGVSQWFWPALICAGFAYMSAGLVAFILNYRRLNDVNERRRMRVVVVGTVIGLLGGMTSVLVYNIRPAFAPAFFSSPAPALSQILFLAFPLSFAYAILRHRVFDIRVMVRQGLQYALARRLLVSVVPVLAGILVLDLALHGEQPLAAILRARGWMYATLGALALTANAYRQRWLAALDRRFFRERYDAERLLREMVEEVRQAPSLEGLAARVVARIETALHPEFAALLVREPQEAGYRTVAAAPAGQAPPPLSAESKLMSLVRLFGKPLDLTPSDSNWLTQQLPHEETQFLRQARMDLLVPIATAPGQTEALLALGVKRSEEPYTGEDRDLLSGIAASLALLLQRPARAAAPTAAASGFEECPQCGACYDSGAGRCSQEGAPLQPVRLPRLLAGRYYLERCLGKGGMGAVYAATDRALERPVAVKLIRDELLGSGEAAERFRREARAAAAFAHPNVVTIYDFGIADAARAFLVMELLNGATLREELRRCGRLPGARSLEILRGVCAAVEAAHRRQLIHRDLKPENIFLARVDAGEAPKVLDFGVAKFLPASTESTVDTGTGAGQLVGTLRYMSPEQLRGRPAETTWDLWALGVLAYEMLAGAYPFAGATAAEWHSAILSGRFIPVSTHLPQAPRQWQEFFARAFASDAAGRFASARDFFTDLERALAAAAASAEAGS